MFRPGRFVPAVVLLAAALGAGLAGCGPASETNTEVHASVRPEALVINVCTLTDVGAIANITARVIDEELPENTLALEGYTLEFRPAAEGAPPIAGGTFGETSVLPVSDLPVVFVDRGRKAAFDAALASGPFDPSSEFFDYTVVYTFFGKDRFGTAFSTRAATPFGMVRCPLSLSPREIKVTGIDNGTLGDDDLSDDITFYVAGGMGSYSVVSDNIGIIQSPGPLPPDTSSFTVDPDDVMTRTNVTLTVSDTGNGDSVEAVVTVTQP
ncbi:MAG: hypothetical protein P8Y39_07010 [Nitrospirota bacterium]